MKAVEESEGQLLHICSSSHKPCQSATQGHKPTLLQPHYPGMRPSARKVDAEGK